MIDYKQLYLQYLHLSGEQGEQEWAKVAGELETIVATKPPYEENKYYSELELSKLFWLDRYHYEKNYSGPAQRIQQAAREKPASLIKPSEYVKGLVQYETVTLPANMNIASVRTAASNAGIRITTKRIKSGFTITKL